ncbi:hypothetical protein K7432_005841 [Basidiobolus ranarum]|uniref:Uncharacterized protein n=1 Tax=Basidiobolus ranarum TaxID=34480 RepID=A0ABR2WVT9_9FUNG
MTSASTSVFLTSSMTVFPTITITIVFIIIVITVTTSKFVCSSTTSAMAYSLITRILRALKYTGIDSKGCGENE